mmetsp:Transcript_1118/g.3150  ORF Transcript_1118/g.3150 Transcript_1118/m.3150 type:complete len:294 (+) Transcript_1118:831-1712(+)
MASTRSSPPPARTTPSSWTPRAAPGLLGRERTASWAPARRRPRSFPRACSGRSSTRRWSSPLRGSATRSSSRRRATCTPAAAASTAASASAVTSQSASPPGCPSGRRGRGLSRSRQAASTASLSTTLAASGSGERFPPTGRRACRRIARAPPGSSPLRKRALATPRWCSSSLLFRHSCPQAYAPWPRPRASSTPSSSATTASATCSGRPPPAMTPWGRLQPRWTPPSERPEPPPPPCPRLARAASARWTRSMMPSSPWGCLASRPLRSTSRSLHWGSAARGPRNYSDAATHSL